MKKLGAIVASTEHGVTAKEIQKQYDTYVHEQKEKACTKARRAKKLKRQQEQHGKQNNLRP